MEALSTEVASVMMPPRSTLRPEPKLRASARPGGSLPFGPVSTTKSAAS